jgi:hypothetical protein
MFYYFNIGALCPSKAYELNNYVRPCQFFHNFAPFWSAWMSWWLLQWGVHDFENVSPYHTFGNEITVSYHAVDNG